MSRIRFMRVLFVIISITATAVQTTGWIRKGNNSITSICNASSSLDHHTLHLRDENVSINVNCRVENVVNLTIQGSSEQRPTIRCLRKQGTVSSTAFTFNNVSSLTIANVNFVGCGGILTKDDINNSSNSSIFFFGERTTAVILCTFCYNLLFVNITFCDYTGYAFAGINLVGTSILNGIHVYGRDDDHLLYNATICELPEYKYACQYRGILLLFVDSGKEKNDSSKVEVSNTVIDNNYYATIEMFGKKYTSLTCVNDIFDEFIEPFRFNYPFPDVGALTIIQNQKFFKVQVTVLNSNFSNNRGTCFGAVLAVLGIPSSLLGQLIFKNCHFYNNSPTFFPKNQGKNYIGVDITIFMQFYNESDNSKCISLFNSSFYTDEFENKLRTASIAVTHFPLTHGKCTLYLENVWTNITTKLLYVSGIYQEDSLDVVMKDIRMIDRHSLRYNIHTIENSGLLTFVHIQNVTLHGTSHENCQFKNLIGPIIVTQSSKLFLTGEMLFANTIASKWATGAAIMLQVSSSIWFQEPLYAIFCNNSAVMGGAIGSIQLVNEFCVLQYYTDNVYHDDNIAMMNITLEFINNTAHLAGNSIYIENLYLCSMRIAPHIRVSNTSVIYSSSFKFVNSINNGLFDMSSTPNKVCVCTGDSTNTAKAALNCAGDTSNIAHISTYPGQTFFINIVVVDEMYNLVFSTIYNTLTPRVDFLHQDKFDWSMGYGQNVALFYGYKCSRLNITIFTHKDEESDGILAIYPYGQQESMPLPITLKECPLGLHLSSDFCNCSALLTKHNFQCSINDETLTKHNPISWVGVVSYDVMNGSKLFLAYASHCSYMHCEPQQVINYNNFDSVCKYNRSGTLCGSCRNNLSTVIGFPECWECSNLWLLTIPLYCLVGVLLVVLLFLLRLTVTMGTINGVIFYANLLNINIFFFLSSNSDTWLRVFISMLNLELGFPICFYNGMSAIDATYLSFSVPIYLWLTLFVIIILSRRFQFVSNLISRSAIPVMATLIHLSFSKLLRLVVDCLLYMKLEIQHEDGNTYFIESRTVWYFDGNVEYFSIKHTFLFCVAIFFLLFYIIPYTSFLTGFKYFLQYRLTNRYWIRPFVDAFCAPFKDKYRYWFGARLWLLIFSYIAYAGLSSQPYLLALIHCILLICFTIIQAALMPYKNTVLNCLDLFFLGNIIILYTLGLYSTNSNSFQVLDNIQIFVRLIMSIAFLMFIGIIAYHVYLVLGHRLVGCFSRTKKEMNREESKFPSETYIKGNDRESENASEISNLNGTTTPTTHVTYSSLVLNNRFIKQYRPGELREPLLEDDTDNN